MRGQIVNVILEVENNPFKDTKFIEIPVNKQKQTEISKLLRGVRK